MESDGKVELLGVVLSYRIRLLCGEEKFLHDLHLCRQVYEPWRVWGHLPQEGCQLLGAQC